jgi:hypothetical protein
MTVSSFVLRLNQDADDLAARVALISSVIESGHVEIVPDEDGAFGGLRLRPDSVAAPLPTLSPGIA